MTDSAVLRLVTPGTEAMLMRRQQSRQSPGRSEAPDSTESMCGEQVRKMGKHFSVLGKICVREDRSLWFLLSYLEETVFYYLEKLNQKGSKLWKPGITRIDGRPGLKSESFLLRLSSSFQNSSGQTYSSLTGDWTILNWRNRITKEKRSIDSGNWKSSNKKLEGHPGIL